MQNRAQRHLHVEVVAFVARQAVFDRAQPIHAGIRQQVEDGIGQQIAGIAVAVLAGDIRTADSSDYWCIGHEMALG